MDFFARTVQVRAILKRKTLPKRFGLLFKRGILFFERKYLFGGLCGVAFLFKRVWRLCRPALP